jgi:hypothetical protein
MTDARIERLKGLADQIPQRDRGFCDSLISQYEKKGKLSEKQWYWVNRIAEQIENPPPPPKEVEVGDLAKLHAMFEHARKHLKHPKIRLMAGEQPVQLHVAGPRSKYAGQVMITDGGKFGQNQWWGVIDADGHWTQTRRGVPEAVEEVVRLMAGDPAGTAAAYGMLTGCCCFCNAKLIDGRSTDIGYGPKCARNYGLKWGVEAARQRQAELKKDGVRVIRIDKDKSKKWMEAAHDAKRFA